MSEWKEYKLGEICDVRDGTHDSPKANPSGYSLVTSKNIKDGKIDLFNTYFISEADYKFVNQRSKVEQWDIIYSMIGTIGECAIVKDVPTFAIKNVGLFKTNGNQLLAQWIYYYLHSSVAQKELTGRIKGSTQQYISLTDLREFPIMIPPIDEQKRIAGVLSSLDDKIDLLNRENATLEALAETLFRHYFIENPDPTWKEGKLGDILSVRGGTTPSTNEPRFWNGNIAWTSPRDVTTLNGMYLFKTERTITEEGLVKISSGLLPAGTLLMSSRAPVGVLAFAEIPVAINQGYIAIIDDKGYPKEFIYLWLKDNMEAVHSYSNGSTFMEISKTAFKSLDITIPDRSTVIEFNEQVKPLFEKIKFNQRQILSLSVQRDMLLPRLMSGEVKIVEQ